MPNTPDADRLKEEIRELKQERSRLVKLAVTQTLKKDTEIQRLKDELYNIEQVLTINHSRDYLLETVQTAAKFTDWLCNEISNKRIDLLSDKRELAYKTDGALKEAIKLNVFKKTLKHTAMPKTKFTTDKIGILSFAPSEVLPEVKGFINTLTPGYKDNVDSLTMKAEDLYSCEDLRDDTDHLPENVREQLQEMYKLMAKKDCSYFRFLY